jgi:hypothetical protein
MIEAVASAAGAAPPTLRAPVEIVQTVQVTGIQAADVDLATLETPPGYTRR